MARLTKEQWLEARQRWEADPTASFVSIGGEIGVSHVAVMNAAKRDGWVKSGNLASINRAAQVKADSAELTSKLTGELTGVSAKRPLAASIEASTDLRSKLIQSHRAEWRKHADLYALESIKADFNQGKSAKISAEMLSIRQKGERVAWGMDTDSGETTITIANPRSFD